MKSKLEKLAKGIRELRNPVFVTAAKAVASELRGDLVADMGRALEPAELEIVARIALVVVSKGIVLDAMRAAELSVSGSGSVEFDVVYGHVVPQYNGPAGEA